MASTVVGLFDHFTDAQNALRDLTTMGIPRDHVSVIASDVAGRAAGYAETDESSSAADNAAAGAATGATGGAIVGAAGGLLLGIGALVIPGLGPLIAAGPLVAALTGAGVGAAAGGVIGALTGAGIPEEDAHHYLEGVRRGGTLVTVNADDTVAARAADVMRQHHVVDIKARADEWKQGGWNGETSVAPPHDSSQTITEETEIRTPMAAHAGPIDVPSVPSRVPEDYVDCNNRPTTE